MERKILDYRCCFGSGKTPMMKAKELGLGIPDIHLYADPMAELARAIYRESGEAFCMLPFCHTIEAEAMGAKVQYGNETAGPRSKDYICTHPTEVLQLPAMDFERGRIAQLLTACESISAEGLPVLLEIAGPITILNLLMDARYIFKALRKEADALQPVLDSLAQQLLAYGQEARKRGVRFFSYADSAGAVNIVGPLLARQMAERFTYPFLQRWQAELGKDCLLILCPKTSLALIGSEKADFVSLRLDRAMSYGEACASVLGKESMVGQMCIQRSTQMLKNAMFRALRLRR